MLDRLQLEYIDLLYVHQPAGDYLGAWKAMEKAVQMGKVRTLGISDFDYDDHMLDDFAQITLADLAADIDDAEQEGC